MLKVRRLRARRSSVAAVFGAGTETVVAVVAIVAETPVVDLVAFVAAAAVAADPSAATCDAATLVVAVSLGAGAVQPVALWRMAPDDACGL